MPDPLTGSGWGANPAPQTNPISLDPNYGQGEHGSFGGGPGANPGNLGDFGSTGSLNKNLMLDNVVAGQFKNQLAPQFASLMGQYGGQAADYYKNLMNLGSPYYKQKQQEAFTQGNQQNQNALGQAQDQLNASGYGSAPSGARAAMVGGMNQQGAQSLAEQYLQNLFQNENLQAQGASGMASMASMFNPTQLLGGTSLGTTPAAGASGFQNFQSIGAGIGGILGSGGVSSLAK
jgi:hypothetical protein